MTSTPSPRDPGAAGDGIAPTPAPGEERRVRVLVCDDQAIVRDGLVTLLSLLPDMEVVGEASDGAEAVRLAAAEQPDVVLMDLRMPVLDGAAATAAILTHRPTTAVLVLTTYADDESIVGALRAGARGYLTKDAGRTELAAAIRSVAEGQSTFAAEVGARLVDTLTGRADPRAATGTARSPGAGGAVSPDTLRLRFTSLTPREADVLALVGEGLSNAEIAARMFVSIATVKTHINSLFAKLGVRDRAQAIALVRS
ncbi:response regulator [Herbiconiux sp. UC225_62]|uniref:response regulator transcription factor n=1 Tax=Herbiconiux sp. UC225_62 TaxID=3350168 RepID=UPI0036D2B793